MDVDYLIIGGGFYGCCLALFLRSVSDKVTLVETEDKILNRASRTNQARVHTGFHYPRSIRTAVKSLVLHKRFCKDFPQAVTDNYKMLYAISKYKSKVSGKRFHTMFAEVGAPIKLASAAQKSLFNEDMIESVFECEEYAFDYTVLQSLLAAQLDAASIDLRMSTSVINLKQTENGVEVDLSNGKQIKAKYVFNITYANVNDILALAEAPPAKLKYELTEIALIKPPEAMNNYAVTVMDGPFFSAMPYPAKSAYSLTHVRYTPHMSWSEGHLNQTEKNILLQDFQNSQASKSHIKLMIKDAERYMPCLADSQWKESLFDIKTVLIKNENDDGRPILYQRQSNDSRIISILGGKIDNIYDLFDLIKQTKKEWQDADDRYVVSTKRELCY